MAVPPAAAGDPGTLPEDDPRFLDLLRSGDEAAYLALVTRHRASMLRVAQAHCRGLDAAEDVVQETWLAVFDGISAFEGRSSLRTWIYTILVNRARTRGSRDARRATLSDVEPATEGDEHGLDPGAFQGEDGPYPGHWARPPRKWEERALPGEDQPERGALARELRERIDAAIAGLPPAQRAVMTLRDVEEMSSEEARNVLGLTETNFRVILHRARARVRREIEEYFRGARRP